MDEAFTHARAIIDDARLSLAGTKLPLLLSSSSDSHAKVSPPHGANQLADALPLLPLHSAEQLNVSDLACPNWCPVVESRPPGPAIAESRFASPSLLAHAFLQRRISDRCWRVASAGQSWGVVEIAERELQRGKGTIDRS